MAVRKREGARGQGIGDMRMKPADKGTSVIGPTTFVFCRWYSLVPYCGLHAGEVGDHPGNKLNGIPTPHFQERFSRISEFEERWNPVFWSQILGACPWDNIVG